MTSSPTLSLADRSIDALRATHDELAPVVRALPAAALSGPSAATAWTVAQVLSHLGSGAEIGLALVRAAQPGEPALPADFNQGVWARWDALSAAEQAAGFLEHDARLLAALDALDSTARQTLQVELGFLPQPLPLAGYLGMRLNEAAAHSWDVRVALDPAAEIADVTAALLTEHLAGGVGFLLGVIGKADRLPGPALVDLGGGLALRIGDGVQLTDLTAAAAEPTATFHGDRAAAVRLLTGRLTPAHTPAAVAVSGAVTLDDLRAVFPGY